MLRNQLGTAKAPAVILHQRTLADGGSSFAGIAFDISNHLLATGITNSRNFPTTQGSFEPQLAGAVDPLSAPTRSFVTVIDMSTPAPSMCFNNLAVDFGNVNANTSANQTLNARSCGNASLDITSISSSDPTVTVTGSSSSVAAGAGCQVTFTFTPVSSKTTNGTITLSDNAQTIPQSVSFTGQGIAPEIVASSNPLSFGYVLVGATAIDAYLYSSNDGQTALSVGAVTLSGKGYSLASKGCSQPVPANQYLGCIFANLFRSRCKCRPAAAAHRISVQLEVDLLASGSAGASSFTALTATVAPGSTANYPVTPTSTATDVAVTCLNLPTGATCACSAAIGAVAIFVRRRWAARYIGLMVFVALALALTVSSSCGGGSSVNGQTQSQTHAATGSGVVILTSQ